MAMSSLRVAVLCCEGLYQRHLIRRVAEEFTLAGVVLQEPPPEGGAAAGPGWRSTAGR